MDFQRIETLNQRMFQKMFRTVKKPCTLVIDPFLRSLVTRMAQSDALTRSFEAITFFDDDFHFGGDRMFVFLIPPDISRVRRIFGLRASSGKPKCPVDLWFQPRLTDAVSAFMVDTGIAPTSLCSTFPGPEQLSALYKGNCSCDDSIELHNLGVDAIPLDDDAITIMSPYSFLRSWCDGDFSVTDEVRHALTLISSRSGFASISTLGNFSSAVGDMLSRPDSSHATHLIIIDRSVDLVTPMITQMSYEGLLSEHCGINCGLVTMPGGDGKQMQILSSKSDALFGCLRMLNYQEASDEIQRRTHLVDTTLSSKSSEPMTLEEGTAKFRAAAKMTLENQTLVDHLNLTQNLLNTMQGSMWFKDIMRVEADILSRSTTKLNAFITDMVERGCDMEEALRMMCLESLMKGGTSHFAKYIQDLHFNYGFQTVPYVLRLEELGLLAPRTEKRCSWSNLIKMFECYSPDWEESGDVGASSYLGYVPLSVRYVERIVLEGSSSVGRCMQDLNEKYRLGSVDDHGSILVCYIGGCTHSELNCFRRLSEKWQRPVQVVTTDFFSSKDFFNHIGRGIPRE